MSVPTTGDPAHARMPPGARDALYDAFARELERATRSLQPVVPIRLRRPEFDVDDAYAIQELQTRARLAAGERLVGRKIGLTSLAVQRQLGVDQPDYGMLFEGMRVDDGGFVDTRRLLQPKVEGEIAFMLRTSLDRGPVDARSFVGAVESAYAALEIVDSRIENWNIGLVDTVADNASSALFVLGVGRTALAGVDLPSAPMRLECDGACVSEGTGSACLGDPVTAAVWLANRMIQLGRPLAAGDVVMSGALGPMVPLTPGHRWELWIGGVGAVRIQT